MKGFVQHKENRHITSPRQARGGSELQKKSRPQRNRRNTPRQNNGPQGDQGNGRLVAH